MRVLHVDTADEWRGGQQQLLELVRRQPGDVHVAVRGDGPLVRPLGTTGVTVHRLPASRRLRAAGALARVASRVRPSLIAAHSSHAHAAAVLLPIPLVVHRRVDFAIRGPLSRMKYRLPRGFVAVSEAVRHELRSAGVMDDRIAVVRDGVDATGVQPRRGGGGIGALGALVAHKGHHVLIDAMTELDLRCRIAGVGPRWGDLQSSIDGLGLSGRVQLVGPVHDRWAFLAAMDVFVHPSVEEGLGQAVIEAMLAGVPVVAAAAGGIPEIIEHGVTGRLVPPGDARALAAAVRDVARHGVRTRRMVVAAEHYAREHLLADAMVEGTMAAYGRFAQR